METCRLIGRFSVKEGPQGEPTLHYEAGPGPVVILKLRSGTSMSEAHQIAKALSVTEEVVIDYSYSPQAQWGYGPGSP